MGELYRLHLHVSSRDGFKCARCEIANDGTAEQGDPCLLGAPRRGILRGMLRKITRLWGRNGGTGRNSPVDCGQPEILLGVQDIFAPGDLG